MDPRFLILFVPIVAVVVYLVRRSLQRARRQRWVEFAERRGLISGTGSTGRMFGVLGGTVVGLAEETRGSGKNQRTVTVASACFGLPMPDGLLVGAEDLPHAAFAENADELVPLDLIVRRFQQAGERERRRRRGDACVARQERIRQPAIPPSAARPLNIKKRT